MKRCIILSLALACAATVAQARIRLVPDDYDTITDAVNAAAPGDTVLVAPGEYNERVAFPIRAITVASLRLTTGEEQFIERTIIDGANLNRSVVRIADNVEDGTVLDGFTIRNGATDYGGGVWIGAARATLRHLVVENHEAERSGGGIYITRGAIVTMENCIVRGNNSFIGGGIVCVSSSRLTAVDCLVEENTTDEHGGGIHCTSQGRLHLQNVVIRNNTGSLFGGGLHGNDQANITMLGGEISGNSGQTGGGITIRGLATARFENVTVRDNETASTGGGLCVQSAEVSAFDCTFIGNNAQGEGGGINHYVGTLSLLRCLVAQNQANRGGGIWVQDGVMNADRITVTDNRAEAAVGLIMVQGNVRLINSILWSEGEAVIESEPERIDTITVSYSDLLGGRDEIILDEEDTLIWGEGNIDQDPLFTAPQDADWTLGAESPCIDAGDPASPPDPDSTRVDMGAFYFHQEDPQPRIAVQPDTLEFALTPVGSTDTMAVVIRNTGRDTLRIERQSIGDEDPPFEIAAGGGEVVLPPRSSHQTLIAFVPRRDGLAEGLFIIASNDPDSASYTVFLLGEGIVLRPRIDLSADSLLFTGLQPDDTASIAIEISNLGNSPLEITAQTIQPEDGPFSFSSGGDAGRLEPDSVWVTTVLFQPLDYGTYVGELVIESDDPEQPTVSIVLMGEVVQSVRDGGIAPREFAISSISPNPFNSTAQVSITIPYDASAAVELFDLQGRRVREVAKGSFHAGEHRLMLNGSGLATGIYVLQVRLLQQSAQSSGLRCKVVVVK